MPAPTHYLAVLKTDTTTDNGQTVPDLNAPFTVGKLGVDLSWVVDEEYAIFPFIYAGDGIATLVAQAVALTQDTFLPSISEVGAELSVTFTASGGTGPYKFEGPEGWAETGTGNSRTYTFTPDAPGEIDLTGAFTVTDSLAAEAVQEELTVSILASELVVDFTPPQTVTIGQPLTVPLNITGGTAPYTIIAPADVAVDQEAQTVTFNYNEVGSLTYADGQFRVVDNTFAGSGSTLEDQIVEVDAFTVIIAAPVLTRVPDAEVHYQFGSDNTAMEDMDGGLAITGPAPTHNTGYARIANAFTGALTLATDDAADITAFIVFRGASDQRFFALNNPSGWNIRTGSDGTHTSMVCQHDGAPNLVSKFRRANEWYFAAISLRADGRQTSLISDFYNLHELDEDKPRLAVTTADITIGGFSNQFDGAVDVAEVVVIHGYKTPAELRDLMNASYARCKARGVTFKVPEQYGTLPVWEDSFDTNEVLSSIFATPAADGIAGYIEPTPQFEADIGADSSLRLEMLRNTDQVTYAGLRWEIEPNQTYAIYYSLAGMVGSNWVVRAGPDAMGVSGAPTFITDSHTSVTKGEQRLQFTAGAADNVLKLLFAVSATTGHFREIAGLRIENITGTVAPKLLASGQQLAVAELPPGNIFVDYENGDNQNDGLTASTPLQTIPVTIAGNSTVYFPRGGLYRDGMTVISTNSALSQRVVLKFDDDLFDPNNLGPGNPCRVTRGAYLPEPLFFENDGTYDFYQTIYPNDRGDAAYNLLLTVGDTYLVPAQYPPSPFRPNQELSGSYLNVAPGDTTQTTMTSSEFPALHAIQPLDSGRVGLRMYNETNNNLYHPAVTITGYTDNGDGTGTVEFQGFEGGPANINKFAIVNHKAGMDIAEGGVFYTTPGSTPLIVFRDLNDADPTGKLMGYAQGGNGIVIKGDYITIEDPIVEYTNGSMIKSFGANRATNPNNGIEVKGAKCRFGTGAGINFQSTVNFLVDRVSVEVVKGKETQDERGAIRIYGCDHGIVSRFETDLIEGNQTHNSSTNYVYFVGGKIGRAMKGHINGARFYGNCSNCALMFVDARKATRGVAVQNTGGNIDIVGSSLHGQLASITYYASVRNNPFPLSNAVIEKGEHIWLNNVFDGNPGLIVSANHTAESQYANNLQVGGMASTIFRNLSQETTADDRFSATSLTMENAGTGYQIGDYVNFGPGPTFNKNSDIEIIVTEVDGGGGILDWTIWKGGLLSSSDLSNQTQRRTVNDRETAAGSGAVVSVLTSRSARPKINTKNLFLEDLRNLNFSPKQADVDASGNIGGYLLDTPATPENTVVLGTGDPDLRDYHPSPASPFDLSGGAAVSYNVPEAERARFGPTWPAGGVDFTWIGRYNPANNQDAWDWENADFQVL